VGSTRLRRPLAPSNAERARSIASRGGHAAVVGLDQTQRVVPLLHDLTAQIDQKCGSTVQRRKESISRGCSILVPDMYSEITMTHRIVPA